MPVFAYKALTAEGKAESGVVDADSAKEARQKLRDKRLRPTEVEPLPATPAAPQVGGVRLPMPRGRRLQELSLLTRQLGTLLSAGIPLMGALTALAEQSEDARMKAALLGVRERVARGSTFSDALAAHGHIFTDLYVNMVRAGEAAGTLDTVLFRLADYLAQQNRLQSKIVAALTYPSIVLTMGVGVVFVLMAYVVPKIVLVFKESRKVLPLPTRVLIEASAFFKTWWPLLLAMLAAAIVLQRMIVRTDAGRLWWDTWMLRVPILGPFFRKAAVSRFAVTLATLLESGLPVLEALLVVRQVVHNRRVAVTLDEVRRRIAEGADIATPLKQGGIFPPVVTYMVAVGEESGRLEELLRRIAVAYDEEIEVAAQKLTAALEPVLIVAMATFVGYIVVSILMPLMQISQLR
jgi:general secretion pathway protein F